MYWTSIETSDEYSVQVLQNIKPYKCSIGFALILFRHRIAQNILSILWLYGYETHASVPLISDTRLWKGSGICWAQLLTGKYKSDPKTHEFSSILDSNAVLLYYWIMFWICIWNSSLLFCRRVCGRVIENHIRRRGKTSDKSYSVLNIDLISNVEPLLL